MEPPLRLFQGNRKVAFGARCLDFLVTLAITVDGTAWGWGDVSYGLLPLDVPDNRVISDQSNDERFTLQCIVSIFQHGDDDDDYRFRVELP